MRIGQYLSSSGIESSGHRPRSRVRIRAGYWLTAVKPSLHDADTDTDADILADILARIVARMSACRSACHRNNFIARVGRVGEYPREDVGVGVGVVECELNSSLFMWRHQLHASAAKRVVWCDRDLRQRRSPARVGVVTRSV